mgnify:FL=1
MNYLGYVYDESSVPRNWLQFADDTAIITSIPEDNQLLLNLFSKWSIWADFDPRVDKCHAFGIKKYATSAIQYQPYLLICNRQIPAIKQNESFEYLGKAFNYEMSFETSKKELMEKIENIISTTDRLPIHPISKLKIINQYMHSKMKWPLSIYKFSETWLRSNCDSLITRYIRKWFNIHPGGNLDHMRLSYKDFGLKLELISDVAKSCQLTVRHLLKTSQSQEIKNLYTLGSHRNIKIDSILENVPSNDISLKQKSKKKMKDEKEGKIWKDFLNLKKENIIIKFLKDHVSSSMTVRWQNISSKLPKNIFSFCRRGLILALPTNSNLKTWNTIPSNTCSLCKEKSETQHHILNNCIVAVNQGRYNWRHDSILNTLFHHLSVLLTNGYRIYIDLPGYNSSSCLFKSYRPDIVIVKDNTAVVIELTVCFETNLIKSRKYKQDRYKNIKNNIINQNMSIKLFCFEVSSIGFISKEVDEFNKWLVRNKIDRDKMFKKCIETAIRASYYIFNRRNKEWTYPKLLDFI